MFTFIALLIQYSGGGKRCFQFTDLANVHCSAGKKVSRQVNLSVPSYESEE